MKKFKWIVFLVYFFVALGAYANEVVFDCVYHQYADSTGMKNFNSPFKLKIKWDEDGGKAYLHRNNQVTKLRVSNSADFVSFVDLSGHGRVRTTSIAKSSGRSVFSLNQYGLSQQAYGSCNFAR